MTVEYKELTVENIADVMVLGLEMHEEALPKKYPVDIEYAAQRCYENVILSDSAFGAVAMDGDEPVGMIMGQLAHYDWAPIMFAYTVGSDNTSLSNVHESGTPPLEGDASPRPRRLRGP